MRYFDMREFRCKDGCGTITKDIEENLQALVDQVLDPVRHLYGKPVKVNSGYRWRVKLKGCETK